jgi:aldose 1-epimerase
MREVEMPDIELAAERVEATVATEGGVLWRLLAQVDGVPVPLMRLPPPGEARPPLSSACFPLVPFGNRIAGNCFAFEGRAYELPPNLTGEEHYLHGDGWLSDWSILDRSADRVSLELDHVSPRSPYAYRVRQDIRLSSQSLRMTLEATNTGEAALPFGLGWHPYFPLTDATTLHAPAASYWTEREGFLPDENVGIPPHLDFRRAKTLPRRWTNNGFEGWDGAAEIVWPERGLGLTITTEPVLSRYFLFLSDSAFDPAYRYDYFCLEPMSHSANAHNLDDGGGLAILRPGEGMRRSVTFSWFRTREIPMGLDQ